MNDAILLQLKQQQTTAPDAAVHENFRDTSQVTTSQFSTS